MSDRDLNSNRPICFLEGSLAMKHETIQGLESSYSAAMQVNQMLDLLPSRLWNRLSFSRDWNSGSWQVSNVLQLTWKLWFDDQSEAIFSISINRNGKVSDKENGSGMYGIVLDDGIAGALADEVVAITIDTDKL